MLTVNNLSCHFPGREKATFQNISMTVGKGECVLLRGRSGCGKSSLLKAIVGIIPELAPASVTGDILFGCERMSGQPLHIVGKKIGMVFQDCRSQFFMSHVDEEIIFAADNYNCDEGAVRERLAHIIPLLRLEHLLHKNLFGLSSGERQRVAIASVAVWSPEVMLFDEPSANLDPEGLSCLAALLQKLKTEGAGLLVADHRIQFLQKVADTCYRMDSGSLNPGSLQQDIEQVNVSCQRGSLATDKPDENNASALMAFTGISFSRKQHHVLKGAQASWNAGEIIAITGGNGEGKTTLLRVLCGLLRPSAGSVAIGGKKYGCSVRLKQCGVVMQDPDYQLFSATVREELFLNQSIEKISLERQGIIESLGLTPLMNMHPGTLSLGEKQRVLLAAAFISGKRILFLDEPTSGMDSRCAHQLSEQIRRYVQQNNLVVLITHDELLLKCTEATSFTLEKGQLYQAGKTPRAKK